MAVHLLVERLNELVGRLRNFSGRPAGEETAAVAVLLSANKVHLGFQEEMAAIIQERQLREQLSAIIREKMVTTVYQPIIDIKTGQTMGYEAFSRGPENSLLATPAQLYTIAVQNKMVFALEQVCRETALKNIQTFSDQMLFVNIDGDAAHDPKFMDDVTQKGIKKTGAGQKIILEINEKAANGDFNRFAEMLLRYRKLGYRIAVDDVGAGYASLQSIAELRPDFLKISSTIIRDIDKNPVKQIILKAMVQLAAVIDCKIIAKGVETKEELSTLLTLDVEFAQGYFLAYPGFPPPEMTAEARNFIEQVCNSSRLEKTRAKELGLSVTIGEIVQYSPTIGKDALVSQVEEIFVNPNVKGVVIVNEGCAVGLLMKHKLYFHLGTHYGVSLYHKRPVELVMDKTPLIVNADLPLESVSRIAMTREEYNLYDLIIVVKDNKYLGTVSIMNLLNNITKLQISCAHNANPLTGLPGNLIIESLIKGLVERKEVFAVLYMDLDNFKAYNDKYGFEMGDKVLLLTASVLSRSLAKAGYGDDFIGHIVGDDFIIVTRPDCAIRVAKTVIEMFDAEVRTLYQPDDLAKGYIEVKNRRGHIEQFPLVAISIAIVSNAGCNFTNYLEIAEVAAELKKKAKQVPTSCYMIDRRVSSLTP